ncbi:MAG: hypothetical protein MUE97_01930 [Phycisphaerales bacterium]|jgi:hypothetical protein|nr:hypothetical protein [Phycisphaerales bacterium]
MFLIALIPLFLLIVLLVMLVLLVREVYRDVRLTKTANMPPACGQCTYHVTADMLQRGRCPECGWAFALAGVDGPVLRVRSRRRSRRIYVLMGCVGVPVSFLLVYPGVLLLETTGLVTSNRTGADWASVGMFGFFVIVLIVLPSVWIARRRRRLLRQAVEAATLKAPPDAQP